MLDMVSRVVFQNPYLYYSIQKNNKETEYARNELIKESIYLSKLIEDESEEDFVKNIVESAEHMDDSEEALIRSDMAIGMLSRKANVLTKLIGQEAGLKDLYTGNTYVGLIKKVTSKCVILEMEGLEEIKLKISNVDILSQKEVFEWKRNNRHLEHFCLTIRLPSSSNEKYLIKMLEHIEPIIDVEITGIEDADDFKDFSISYTTFNKEDKDYVEEYLKGIGGKIIKNNK